MIEVLVRGRYQCVHEIPYAFLARDAGESKMSMVEQWHYIRHIVHLVWTSPEDRRFYVFCLVGALGTLVNLVVMSGLVYGLQVHGITASIIASVAAMLHNFVWNDRVTWKGHAHPSPWRRLLQAPLFMLISSVSIAVTALFVQLALWTRTNEVLGQLVGIAVATVWSFMANNRWTWAARSDGVTRRGSAAISVTQEKARHEGGR
ncbi:MAG: GtrA family protein [Alicyclobacillus sp.]|nr:GtrA family protein [Alicyclobacillus sp.]